jgi:hypothetical protein
VRYFVFFYSCNNGKTSSFGEQGLRLNHFPSSNLVNKHIVSNAPGYSKGQIQIKSFNELTETDYNSWFELNQEEV